MTAHAEAERRTCHWCGEPVWIATGRTCITCFLNTRHARKRCDAKLQALAAGMGET